MRIYPKHWYMDMILLIGCIKNMSDIYEKIVLNIVLILRKQIYFESN